MEVVIRSAGLHGYVEGDVGKKEEKNSQPNSQFYGTTKEMPEPSLKPKPKKPKLDEDNLLQSDRALNFIASVSIAKLWSFYSLTVLQVQPEKVSKQE